jgi:hypothetical protein
MAKSLAHDPPKVLAGWRNIVRYFNGLERDPTQGRVVALSETEIRWLPSNLASVKAFFARKTMR